MTNTERIAQWRGKVRADCLNEMFDIFEQQQAQIEQLKSACESIRDDLLMRADIDEDGTKVVNVSHSIWCKFCDVIEAAQLKNGGEL